MRYFLSWIFALVVGTALGAERVVEPVKLAERPILDGKLDDPCWQKAVRLGPFTNRGQPAKAETWAAVFYDDANLYVGVHCHEPRIERLRRRYTVHDDPIWEDDCVELFICNSPDRAGYFHFIANAVNGRSDGYRPKDVEIREALRYDLDWDSKSFIGADFWSVEFIVPFRTLNLPPGESHELGFTICRERYPENEFPTWQGWFHKPETWGTLKGIRLSRAANPLLYDRFDLGEALWGDNKFSMELRNLGEDEAYVLAVAVFADGREVSSGAQPLRLAKGQITPATQTYYVPIGLRPQKSFLMRVVVHKPGQPEEKALCVGKRFNILSEWPVQITLDSPIHYFADRAAEIRIKAFLSRLALEKGIRLYLRVLDEVGKEMYRKEGISVTSREYAHSFPIGSLSEGWYRVYAEVSDAGTRNMLSTAEMVLCKVQGPFDR